MNSFYHFKMNSKLEFIYYKHVYKKIAKRMLRLDEHHYNIKSLKFNFKLLITEFQQYL